MAKATSGASQKNNTKKPAARKSTASKKGGASAPEPSYLQRNWPYALVCALLALLAFLGFFTVDGFVVAYFCAFLKGVIGYGFWLFPFALALLAWTLVSRRHERFVLRIVSALLLPLLFGALLHLMLCHDAFTTADFRAVVGELYASGKLLTSGGVVSGGIALLLKAALSVYAAIPVVLLVFLYFLMCSLNLTIGKIVSWSREHAAEKYVPAEEDLTPVDGGEPEPYEELPETEPAPSRRRRAPEKPVAKKKFIDIPLDNEPGIRADTDEPLEPLSPVRRKNAKGTGAETRGVAPLSVEEAADLAGVTVADSSEGELVSSARAARRVSAEDAASEAAVITAAIESENADHAQYQFPSVGLLRAGTRSQADATEEIRFNRERLDTALTSFGVNAAIRDITRGPTVTRYDLELEAGVKLNKITNLSGDLALALGVENVRIAPVPDKISTVGIEVPNKVVSMVRLRDIIDTQEFRNAKSKVSFAVGKDISGSNIIGNISKLPHMLIAGTTGSGKSVCMNSLILSLLYKATPDEVRLIMIDPKMVEFGVYNGIPHLYIPVVTDPKKAAGALQWAVVEMLKRYRLFSESQVRDLASYNELQRADPDGETLPQVVIVIDELADLMLCAAKEVEESICRVAQMGRAAGMHLIIATQRPSADVITGLMKANIPSRIALSVSSALESRIILDSQGAEKLIGNGDMLYSPISIGKPLRVQGAFVSDEEREEVINFIKQNSEAQYSDDILAQVEQNAAKNDEKSGGDSAPTEKGSDYDELLPQAVDVILETNQASVSMLQRRLKLGYSRAARLVDQMEEMGVVGPFEGSKPRKILITKQQWQEMQYVQGTAPGEVLQTQMEFASDEEEDEDEL